MTCVINTKRFPLIPSLISDLQTAFGRYWQIQGAMMGAPECASLLLVQFLSFSCSSHRKSCQIIVYAPNSGVASPSIPSGKSWVRHWKFNGKCHRIAVRGGSRISWWERGDTSPEGNTPTLYGAECFNKLHEINNNLVRMKDIDP